MKEWKEEDAPFVKVATIRIPSQKFDFDERKRLDEGLLFTPWHTLPEHEPLGSVNLARKKFTKNLRSLDANTWRSVSESLNLILLSKMSRVINASLANV